MERLPALGLASTHRLRIYSTFSCSVVVTALCPWCCCIDMLPLANNLQYLVTVRAHFCAATYLVPLGMHAVLLTGEIRAKPTTVAIPFKHQPAADTGYSIVVSHTLVVSALSMYKESALLFPFHTQSV